MRAEVDTKLDAKALEAALDAWYEGHPSTHRATTRLALRKAIRAYLSSIEPPALSTLQMQSSDPEELERVEEQVKSLLAAPMQSEAVAWRWRSKDPQHDHRWIYTESDDIAAAAKDRPNLFEVEPLFPASQADFREALTKVRDAITAPVNSLAIVDTVWMPLERDPGASIETLVDFIEATLARSPQ